jgi:hypothetical protein
VGNSVCKSAGLKAHSDQQNFRTVVLHGKTAYIVGFHPQLVDRFTPFLAMMFVYYKDSITPKIM